MPPTIEEILLAFEELQTGAGKTPDDDPIKWSTMGAFADAHEGLTASEIVKAVLGRELTREEHDLVYLKTEPSEGHT